MYGSQRSNLDGNQHGSSEHVVGRGCGGDATPIPIGSGCSRFLVTTAGGAGLGIIDITDLSHPRFITAFPTLDMGTDVAVVSHTAAPPNDETGVFGVNSRPNCTASSRPKCTTRTGDGRAKLLTIA